MFIKLTRLDATPIWLNASFIVTVEPRKGGGAVVVPIGDGLDYDVRESPDAVLAMLDGAPVASVVPVPPPKGLAPTPDDVSPEPEPHKAELRVDQIVADQAVAVSSPSETSQPSEAPDLPTPDAKPADEGTDVFAASLSAGTVCPEPPKKARKPRQPRKTKKVEVKLSGDQVARLRKMAPRSVRKLQNTLLTQFGVADATIAVESLASSGVISVDRDHVIWNAGKEE